MKKMVAIITGVLGTVLGAGIVYKLEHDKYKEVVEVNCKDNQILQVLTKWVRLKQDEKDIADYLIENGYNSAAIYGMNYLGECLLNELINSEVQVKYAIDRNASSLYADVDILTLDDNIPEVDAIIVAAFWYFDEINESISEVVNYPVISLKDIICDMESQDRG